MALGHGVILLLLAGITAALWFLSSLLPQYHPCEPPVVQSRIPYIGHIISFMRNGHEYLRVISNKCKLPIFTLPMLNGKVYVVTSPELVAAVNRNSKSLAFNPFIAQIGKRITGHDEATGQIVQHNLNGENGPGYVIEVHDAIVTALAPGGEIDRMAYKFSQEFSPGKNKMDEHGSVKLYEWMKAAMTSAGTEVLYGNDNPFAAPSKLGDEFWHFDNEVNTLIIDVFPWLLAPRAHRARSALYTAFDRYFSGFSEKDVGSREISDMILGRYSTALKYGLTTANQGKLEVGTLLGVLVNAVPAAFYMIVRVFSDPQLLADIREEQRVVAGEQDITGQYNLRMHRLRRDHSLLYSTWLEVLRLHARGASSRFVREDTWLNASTLLCKDQVVMIPQSVLHEDESVWGPTVRDFNPRRFLSKESGGVGVKENQTSFRPFGGGASLCPGRHFATVEVMGLTALLVMWYDIEPVGGEWKLPDQRQKSVATNIFPPKEDLEVRFRKRKNWERWTISK